MNKKRKGGAMTPYTAFLIAAILAVVALPLRTYQLANLINPDTGFWEVRDETSYILYGLIAVTAIVSFIFSKYSKGIKGTEFRENRNIWLSVTSGLFGLGLLYDAYIQSATIKGIAGTFNPEVTSFGFFIMSTGILTKGFQVLFALLSAVYLGIIAISNFKGDGQYKEHRLIALSPALWAVCRVLFFFVEPISYRNVSQMFIEILYLIFAMVFFFVFARIASGVNPPENPWLLFFAGITASFIAAICALAPFALTITGRSYFVATEHPLQYADVAATLMIITVLLSNLPVGNKVEER